MLAVYRRKVFVSVRDRGETRLTCCMIELFLESDCPRKGTFMEEQKRYLALYGFRSKQEFIYRTNKMKQITGASELMANIYVQFLNDAAKDPASRDYCQSVPALSIDTAWAKGEGQGKEPCEWQGLGSNDAVVVYDGGSNLCMLYKDRETYISANKIFSQLVLRHGYGLELLAAGVPSNISDGDQSPYKEEIKKLHAKLDEYKKLAPLTVPVNLLPYTQVDRVSFQPIVEKGREAGREELSREVE